MLRIIIALVAAYGLFWLWNTLFGAEDTTAALDPKQASQTLNSAEQRYYVTMFNYTMNNIQPGQKQDWKTFAGNGAFIPSDLFVSKSHYYCRNYEETITIGELTGDTQGIACKRQGNAGWCKLGAGDALNCALESDPVTFGHINLPATSITLPGLPGSGVTVGGGTLQIPNVNSAEFRSGETPEMPTGQEYADTVTGAAGSAAGPVTRTAIETFIKWFH